MPTPIADALAAEFNRRLGNKIGAPVLPTPMSLTEGTDAARIRAQNRHAAQIFDILRKSQEIQRLKAMGGEGSGGGGSSDGLSDDTKAVIREAKDSGFADQFKPKPMDFLPMMAGLPPSGVRNFALRPFKGVLDQLSRGGWGLHEMFKERSESLGEGQNEIQAIPEELGGLWSGLRGKEKTGWGEVVEANANRGTAIPGITDHGSKLGSYLDYLNPSQNPFNPLNAGIGWNEQEKLHPKLAPFIQAAKLPTSFAGEMVMDPLNLAGGAVGAAIRPGPLEDLPADATKLQKLWHGLGQGGEKGVPYTAEGAKAMSMEAAEEALDKRGWGQAFRKKKLVTTGVSPWGGKTTGNVSNLNRLEEIVSKTIDNVLLKIHGGSTAGRVKGIELAPQSITAAVVEAIRKFHFTQFDDNLLQYESHLFGPNKLSAADIAAKRATDPIFNTYMDEILKQMNRGRTKTPFATIDAALAHFKTRPTAKWKQWSNEAVKTAKKGMDAEFEDMSSEILDKLTGRIYNNPGVRLGSKVLPFDRVGRAYETVMREVFKGSESLEKFSFGRQFPGRSSLASQKIASTGLKAFEDFHKEVQAAAHGFSEKEAEQITDSIIKEYDFPGDPRMQAAKDFVVRKYEEQRLAEEAGGIRGGKRVRNYVYNYYKGAITPKGRPRHIANYKADVQEYLAAQRKRPGSMVFNSDHVDKAVAQGLRPEQNAFRALIYRQLKSNRLLSKSHFTEDLLDHYGVLADNLSGTAARARGLQPVLTNIPKHITNAMGPRQRWYLPQDVSEIYKHFTNLASGTHNEGINTLTRTYDRLLRLFKFSTTIPYPGFHIRNAIGDIFMSHFDGVRFDDYKRTMDLFRKRNVQGPRTAGQIYIGDRHFGFNQLWAMFKSDASSGGFFNTDLAKTGALAKIDPNRVLGGLRTGSAFREDFFRFSSWLHAFREEYPKTLKEAGTVDRAMRNAREAATYRVNKYMFDYNALTKTERNSMRRVIPFYTYTRKIMPSLLEGAFLRPDIMSKVNRMFLTPDENKTQDLMVPDYLREIGYSVLPGGDPKQPNLLSGGIFPTDIANKNLNFSSNESFFGNLISQLNPLAKAPFELQRGKLYFNDQPIDSQRGYYLNSFAPLAGNVGSAMDMALPGKPMQTVFKALGLGDLHEKSGPQQIISNRFGLGIPVSKLTDKQQNAAYYDTRQDIYDSLDHYNEKLVDKGIKINLSQRKNDTTYRVVDIKSGHVYFDSTNPQEAIQFAQQFGS